jgi:tetratricopeptide (TPR) repeat protein
MIKILNEYYQLPSIDNTRRKVNRFLSKDDSQLSKQLVISQKDNQLALEIVKSCIKEMISNSSQTMNNKIVLFIDAEFYEESSAIVSKILQHSILPCPSLSSSCKLLSKEYTLENFIKKSDFKNNVKDSFFSFVESWTSLHYSEKISNDYLDYVRSANKILSDYLSWLAKEQDLLLVINKVQLLSKLELENLSNIFSSIPYEWQLMTIVTETSETITDRSILFFDDFLEIEAKKLSKNEVYLLLENILTINGYHEKEVALLKEECYKTYLGSASNTVEYVKHACKNKVQKFISNEETVSLLIEELTFFEKEILVLSALFDTGIKSNYLKDILKYVHSEVTHEEFHDSLNRLTKEELIKMKNEKVVLNENTASKELIADFIKSTITEDESVMHSLTCIAESSLSNIDKKNITEDDFLFYVDLSFHIKPEILKKHISLLCDFVQMLASMGYYNRIVNIYDELVLNSSEESSIIKYLPLTTINTFLDAMQKTSNFEKGLSLAHSIDNESSNILYQARFKLQLYKYQEALELLKPFKNRSKYFLTYLNTIQHLRKDDLAYKETINYLTSSIDKGEIYHIVLRNTGHLFEVQQAIDHLNSAINYFENEDMIFQQATCCNNLGLLYLYNKNTKQALKSFNQASKLLVEIESNEIYQVHFNLGVLHTFERNYILAQANFEMALKQVPKTLEFDKIKLEVNYLLLKFLTNEISHEDTLYTLLNLSTNNLPDPWLNYFISYNIAILTNFTNDQLKNDHLQALKEGYIGNPDIYGIYHSFEKERKEYNFLFAPSPNWRY